MLRHHLCVSVCTKKQAEMKFCRTLRIYDDLLQMHLELAVPQGKVTKCFGHVQLARSIFAPQISQATATWLLSCGLFILIRSSGKSCGPHPSSLHIISSALSQKNTDVPVAAVMIWELQNKMQEETVVGTVAV